jgi:hypothetical protein
MSNERHVSLQREWMKRAGDNVRPLPIALCCGVETSAYFVIHCQLTAAIRQA